MKHPWYIGQWYLVLPSELAVRVVPHPCSLLFVAEGQQAPAAGNGWFSQQVAKLFASTIVTTPQFLVLDVKSAIFQPLRPQYLATFQNSATRPPGLGKSPD